MKKNAGAEQLSRYIHSKSTASFGELKKQFIFEEVNIEEEKPTYLGYCGQNKARSTSSYSPTPASGRRSRRACAHFHATDARRGVDIGLFRSSCHLMGWGSSNHRRKVTLISRSW